MNQCSVVSAVDGGVCFVLTAEAVGWACGVSIGCDIGDTSTNSALRWDCIGPVDDLGSDRAVTGAGGVGVLNRLTHAGAVCGERWRVESEDDSR